MYKSLLSTLAFLLIFILTGFAQNEVVYPTSITKAVYFDVSLPLRDIIPIPPQEADRTWKNGVVKNFLNLRQPDTTPVVDMVAQRYQGKWISRGIGVNINGVGNINNVMPPDTEGDVGPNHYFQMINLSFQIFDKNGASVYGPAANSTIWSGFPGPWAGTNDGDPIVLYDEFADRWIASQFALPNYPNGPFWELIAISTSPDPTGSWYRYAFQFTDMPDYPKLGVWNNAYLLTVNRFSSGSTTYKGVGAYALERSKMLIGDPNAAMISFTYGTNGPYSMLPADADGTLPPENEPAYFAYKSDPNQLVIYKMNIDWANPTASTFGIDQSILVAFYSSNISGIPQPGTTRKLDPITDRLMFRLQYRNFGSHASMVTNHTVNVSGTAGVRWYEVRKTPTTSWSLYQQGTYAPDNVNRWMGSIAMDAFGNIALGYSVSSSTVYPGIRYTGRLVSDSLGEMTIEETTIVNGGGSQTGGFMGNGRWGDYSSMSIDPSAPATFWYTQEYMQSTSSQGWKTRIASFSFENVFAVTLTANPDHICFGDSSQLNALAMGGTGSYTYSWTSYPEGFFSNQPDPWVSPTDTTIYICQVINGSDTISDSISVFVNLPPMVWVGNDTVICANNTLQLNALAANYDSLMWFTSGDGTFSATNTTAPIYTPGAGDIANGNVNLSLHATALTGCPGPAIDEMTLNITPLPIVSAGIDTLICFWELPFGCLGEASNTSSVYWTTYGDGSFDNPENLNASYFAGPNDKANGSVILKLSGQPISPCVDDVSDEMTLYLDPCVGIVENSSPDFKLQIQPNPNNGNFFLTLNTSKSIEIVVSIIDSKGNEVYRNSLSSSQLQQYPINLGNLSSGIYLLKVESKIGNASAKIILK